MAENDVAGALKSALVGHKGDLTVADAAARAGLSLRDAERALTVLLDMYPGRLKTTDEGELLYSFPEGLEKPRKEKTLWHRATTAIGRAFMGAARFMLRAWISVVLIGYAAAFVAIIIGLTLSKQNDDDRRGGGDLGMFAWVLLRAISEALWWTFHPFSPFATYSIWDDPRTTRKKITKKKNEESFYEKVNRFVFGPPKPVPDPREQERRIIALIRGQKGRIGLHDVIKATGLTRDVADPMMARLMLDYEGEVSVSEDGGIFYTFEKLRKTVEGELSVNPSSVKPAWAEKLTMPKLTGNPFGSNLMITLVNGFNLMMSIIVLNTGLTIANIQNLFAGIPVEALPLDGTPIVFGVIPLFFSLAIFAFPMLRAFKQPALQKEIETENGRRAILRTVLGEKKGEPVSVGTIARAWQEHTGKPPDEEALTREIVAMGGDVDVTEDGRALYRFRDLEAEVKALQDERARADENEAKVGQVIFDTHVN
jgi:hypothetical protein